VDVRFAHLGAFDFAVAALRDATSARLSSALVAELELAVLVATIKRLLTPVVALLRKGDHAVPTLGKSNADLPFLVALWWFTDKSRLHLATVCTAAIRIGLVPVIARFVVVKVSVATGSGDIVACPPRTQIDRVRGSARRASGTTAPAPHTTAASTTARRCFWFAVASKRKRRQEEESRGCTQVE
jgi:hypothetical protein